MRDRFNEQLEQLNVELIKMGALCEEAISAATKALLDGDDALRESAAGCPSLRWPGTPSSWSPTA